MFSVIFISMAMSLEEALAFHGLSKEVASAELIRWLGSVRLENPELYKALIADPPHVKRAMGIRVWDFAFSTGMTVDYPVRRGWNEFMAVRELVQNALDVEERLYGYEGIATKVWVDDLGLHVADRGPGITYDAFKLGGSDKAIYERGYFGEGLKVCMAFFASIPRPVYMFTRKGQVFKSVAAPGTGLILVVMGRAKPVVGTEALVYGYYPSVEDVKRIIFQEWMKDPRYFVLAKVMRKFAACPERPHFIVSHVDRKTPVDYLWVRDISVNRLSSLTRYPSIYGYNVWFVTLEPNRVAVSSLPELQREIAAVFTPESIRDLLERVVEGNSVKRELFEVESVNWSYASKAVLAEVAKWVKEKGYGWTDNERALDWALYMGLKPLVVPFSMRELFREAPTLEDLAIVKGVERVETAEAHAVPREELSLKEACRLTACEIIITDIHLDLMGANVPVPRIIVTEEMDASGTAVGDKIYIHRSALDYIPEAMETALHEYAHYFGKDRYGEALDISREFEKALSIVASACLRIDNRARQAYERALNGAWGAKAHQWVGTRYVYLPRLSDRFEMKVAEALKVVFNYPAASCVLEDRVADEINLKVPPLAVLVPLYREDEKRIREDGYLYIDLARFRPYGTLSDIYDWGIPNPKIELYMAVVSRVMKGAEETLPSVPWKWLIFIYNPEKDDYELWSEKTME
jgi:hypothetical protein